MGDAGLGEGSDALDAVAPRENRHIQLGVSHPSGTPDRHRTFEIRAIYDTTSGGWVAEVGEQDRNAQRGDWETATPAGRWQQAFPSPAACLGHAVTMIVALVDRAASRE